MLYQNVPFALPIHLGLKLYMARDTLCCYSNQAELYLSFHHALLVLLVKPTSALINFP